MNVNLFPFFIEALGVNKKIYKDIDKLYQKHKFEFYKAAKEHELYNHQIVTEGSLIQEEYCKKALGILAGAGDKQEVLDELNNIIRKGFTYTYLYVNNHETIDMDKFIKALEKKYKGLANISDDELHANLTVLVILAMNNDKIINKDSPMYEAFCQAMNDRWEHYKQDNKTRIGIEKISDDDKKRIKDLKLALFNEYGRISNFWELLDKQFDKKGLEQWAFLFDYENLSSISIFQDIKFGDKDIDEILYLYIMTNKYNINIQEALSFLISSIYVKYLIKAYKQVKQMYFANNKETMFVELEGIENELQDCKDELSVKDNKILELQNRIEALERDNKRLWAEIVESEGNKQELNSLREFVFGLDNKQEYKVKELDFEGLKDLKGLIIGGHENWQRKMKELLPSFKFIPPDALNFDVSILEGVEGIFIYTNYLNHGMYYKLINEVRKKDLPLYYLNYNVNENIVLQQIADIFKQ